MPEHNDDNNTICEALEEAQTALQRAQTRFKRVYPEADLGDDTFFITIRSLQGHIEDLAYEVENR
jgi:hypothetical protein